MVGGVNRFNQQTMNGLLTCCEEHGDTNSALAIHEVKYAEHSLTGRIPSIVQYPPSPLSQFPFVVKYCNDSAVLVLASLGSFDVDLELTHAVTRLASYLDHVC